MAPNARNSQGVAVVANESPSAAKSSQALAVVANESPSAAKSSQALVVTPTQRGSAARGSQHVIIIVAPRPLPPVPVRDSQNVVTVAARLLTSPSGVTAHATQGLTLLVGDAGCPDTMAGYWTIGLAEMLARLKRLLGGIGAFWTDAQLVRHLNDANVHLVARMKLLEVSWATSTVAGQRAYPLPADLVKTVRVFYDDYPLLPITALELDGYSPGWDGSSGRVRRYRELAGRSIDLDFPPTGVKDLVVWYYATPGDNGLVADCDAPPGPGVFHLAIVYAAAASALSKRGEQGNAATAGVYRRIAETMAAMLASVRGRT